MSIENPNNLYSEEEAFKEANKMKKLIDEGKASNYDEAEKIINQENEAFDEANKMRKKIESGEAKDYNEAERLVEIEEKKTLFKKQIKELVANAEIILNSKEYQDPEQKKEQAKLLEEYRNKIAQLLNLPSQQIYLLDLIKDNANIDKLINNINKEKKQQAPEAVEKAKELIKKEEKKGKESLFKKAGGWETALTFGGFSLTMLLLLIFMGVFKIWEKATGWNLDVGGGKGKK